MMLSPEDWHMRYCEQARWTKPIREHLFEKAGLKQNKKILEIGCGTGAILQELSVKPWSALVGLDISSVNLHLAHNYAPGVLLEQADAHHLPFLSNKFDIVYTHYVLLWLNNPLNAIREMCRVTRPGGHILALAEPDYGGRIDNPSELSVIGNWQIDSLRSQGANPFIGRELGELLLTAGLTKVQSGVMGGEWQHLATTNTNKLEWEILLSDLESLPHAPPEWEIQHLQELETKALNKGTRLLYVPTFFALGQVPE